MKRTTTTEQTNDQNVNINNDQTLSEQTTTESTDQNSGTLSSNLIKHGTATLVVALPNNQAPVLSLSNANNMRDKVWRSAYKAALSDLAEIAIHQYDQATAGNPSLSERRRAEASVSSVNDALASLKVAYAQALEDLIG